MDRSLVRVSRFLSRVLRHRPDEIGLRLDAAGWADVQELLERSAAAGMPLSAETLEAVVEQNDKQRFALSPDRRRIRANQGHTVPVDLGLAPVPAPEVLFHGTGHRAVDAILTEGLRPQGRHHVHLSGGPDTAVAVGRRHGRPVVLRVDARRMEDEGWAFSRSDNGVWLVDHVPPQFLSRDEMPSG